MNLTREREFWIRADNREADVVIVRDIYEQDAYGLRGLVDTPRVIVDVGAHIGCFTRLARTRFPQARLIAVECCRENLDALERNVGEFAHIVPAALTYERDVVLLNAVYPHCESTGGSAVLTREALRERAQRTQLPDRPEPRSTRPYWADYRPLATLTIEDLLSRFDIESIDLLKLDCEGSELSILSNCGCLDRVKVIVGEYHGWEAFRQVIEQRLPDWHLDVRQPGNVGLFQLTNPRACLAMTNGCGKGSCATECGRCRKRTTSVQPRRYLLKFSHGLGDAVQLTSVLRHLRAQRPNWIVDVAALRGKHTALQGLCRRVFVLGEQPLPEEDYDHVLNLGWHECDACSVDTPSTKVERCLREVFTIEPTRESCGYEIQIGGEAAAAARRYLARICGDRTRHDGRYQAVVIHYQGNTSPSYKNLPHSVVAEFCEGLIARGIVPIILDWDRRSPLPDGRRIHCPAADHPLWRGAGTGDAELLAALIGNATAMFGIDSGPLHVALATATPVLAVWTRHHPIHYVPPREATLHFVPFDHESLLRGRSEHGRSYFERTYRYETYRALSELPERWLQSFDEIASSAPVYRHIAPADADGAGHPRIEVTQSETDSPEPEMDFPIFIAGVPRSGTTWMQWFLSQHPQIHIHGQSPNLDWRHVWKWYDALQDSSIWAAQANQQVGYSLAHYAGSTVDDLRRRFREFLRAYLTGFGPKSLGWGFKSLTLCIDGDCAERFEQLWPSLKWVVCVREPWRTIASHRNTFRPELDLNAAARSWVEMCAFAMNRNPKRTFVFQIDRLNTPEERLEASGQLLDFLGYSHTAETRHAALEFPVIHKVKDDFDRNFELTADDRLRLLADVPQLTSWCEQFGYPTSVLAENVCELPL